MPSTAARVRKQVMSFPQDCIFTTGQLLSCGKRNALDIELCRLVKRGQIRRVAQGVFVTITSAIPTAMEIAKAKAERFGKRLLENHNQAAERHRVFYTDGSCGSFRSIYGVLTFRHLAPSARTKPDNPHLAFKPGDQEFNQKTELSPYRIMDHANRLFQLLIRVLERVEYALTPQLTGISILE